jgi:lipopolysaccharide/colanic/teichoic acid biosynthesis glycosyltransferase
MSESPTLAPPAPPLPAEPPQAFHCKPPDEAVRQQYAHLFDLPGPLPERFAKLAFDKAVALLALVALSPVILALYLANLLEGLLIRENRGPFVFSYIASSAGRKFRKHKIRQIKMGAIDAELAAKGDWHAFAKEWAPESRTWVGRVVKALYLDELPQLWDILVGDMSFVGPRPLAWHHYERDLAQGNVTRRLLKGGLLGPGQALKGTAEMGNPAGDFEYVERYRNSTSLGLLWLDLRIIARGVAVVFRKRGL